MSTDGTDPPSVEPEEAWVGPLVTELGAALAADFGTDQLPAPAGWEFGGVEPRSFMKRVPVALFRHGEQRLCFIVTPTDPREQAYKRTARHDITYFSEDVPDDAQDQIYRRDREMIEAFARWLARRDSPARSTR
jgi:hypothetical protein